MNETTQDMTAMSEVVIHDDPDAPRSIGDILNPRERKHPALNPSPQYLREVNDLQSQMDIIRTAALTIFDYLTDAHLGSDAQGYALALAACNRAFAQLQAGGIEPGIVIALCMARLAQRHGDAISYAGLARERQKARERVFMGEV